MWHLPLGQQQLQQVPSSETHDINEGTDHFVNVNITVSSDPMSRDSIATYEM